MSCHEADEVDLPGFLAEPDAPGFQEFRNHYPRCADCTAEVRAFARLEYALLDGVPTSAPSHPEAEHLATWVGAPGALRAARRLQIERHVEVCPDCREQVATLRSLRPAPIALPLPSPRPGRARGAAAAAGRGAAALLQRAGPGRTALWSAVGLLMAIGFYLSASGGSDPVPTVSRERPAVVASARYRPGFPRRALARPEAPTPVAARPLAPERPAVDPAP